MVVIPRALPPLLYDSTYHAWPTQVQQPALSLYESGLVLSPSAGYDYQMGL